MKGMYYKIPFDFEALTEKDTEKVALDISIRQHIFLLATTDLEIKRRVRLVQPFHKTPGRLRCR